MLALKAFVQQRKLLFGLSGLAAAGWCAVKLSGGPRLGFSWEPLSLYATYPDRKVYIFKKVVKSKRAKPHRIQ